MQCRKRLKHNIANINGKPSGGGDEDGGGAWCDRLWCLCEGGRTRMPVRMVDIKQLIRKLKYELLALTIVTVTYQEILETMS
jgi:hypothetical protein